MNIDSIVFALSNPITEIFPKDAIRGGARIVATGRSDFPNQINNVLAFPGIFKGALHARIKKITKTHKIRAAKSIAGLIKKPTIDRILPEALDLKVVQAVAKIFS